LILTKTPTNHKKVRIYKMNAYFLFEDNSKVEASAKLAELLHTVFASASASSAVAFRGERANLLVKRYDKLVSAMTQEVIVKDETTEEEKIESILAKTIIIDSDDETIEVKTHNLLARLSNIPSAIACNKEYKANVTITPKVASNGKKGRKALDLEKEADAAFDD
jgi:hypothetical protein